MPPDAPLIPRRSWAGFCRYMGREPFYLGTVLADGAEHARRELLALWARLSPHPPPDEITPVPGAVFFQEAEDA